MNPADVAPWLLLLIGAILLPTVVVLIVDAIWPEDRGQLPPTWRPEEGPGAQRRACLDPRCRVDHERIRAQSNRVIW